MSVNIAEYHDLLVLIAQRDARIAELELASKPLYSRRQLECRIAELESALRELLQDTQHAGHNCGDGPDLCPVLRAREVLNELMER